MKTNKKRNKSMYQKHQSKRIEIRKNRRKQRQRNQGDVAEIAHICMMKNEKRII